MLIDNVLFLLASNLECYFQYFTPQISESMCYKHTYLVKSFYQHEFELFFKTKRKILLINSTLLDIFFPLTLYPQHSPIFCSHSTCIERNKWKLIDSCSYPISEPAELTNQRSLSGCLFCNMATLRILQKGNEFVQKPTLFEK